MEYTIDGIRETEINKAILFHAADIKLGKKNDLYIEIRKKLPMKIQHFSKPPLISAHTRRTFKELK